MKNQVTTQLSYLAQALVAVGKEQWKSILDEAENSKPEPEVKTVLDVLRKQLKNNTLKDVTEELLKASEASLVSAGRILAWTMEQHQASTRGARPAARESAPPR